MELTFYHNAIAYTFNTLHPIDISIPVRHDGQGVNCFHTQNPVIKPFEIGDFVGSVGQGGACNVDVITFCPHGSGTHTEGIGHITPEHQTIMESLHQGIRVAGLITMHPISVENDWVINQKMLELADISQELDTIIIRTIPNDDSKTSKQYSDTNPPYFLAEALDFLRSKGIKHLLCDLPSVDKEKDGGNLLAHKAFFGLPDAPEWNSTITELIYVPNEVKDGLYILNLQTAGFQSDASPSRPQLYEVQMVF